MARLVYAITRRNNIITIRSRVGVYAALLCLSGAIMSFPNDIGTAAILVGIVIFVWAISSLDNQWPK